MRLAYIGIASALVLAVLTGGTYPPKDDRETGRVVPEELYWAVPKADVLIDAGHGGIDSGTSWGDILEKDINLAIARKLYLLLRSKGIAAVLNRTGDYALSDENRWHASRSRHRRDLSQRGGLTDEIEASLFVSIHVNWAAGGGERGPLVLYRSGDGGGALLASFLQDSLNLQQGFRTLPKPSKKYYLLNRVNAPCVIVETAFLSDPRDRLLLTSPHGQTEIAKAIASGIMAYRWIAP